MSLNSQIETAKDAVSKALITALQNKNESAISNLITCYNTLYNIKIVESNKINITDGAFYTTQYDVSTVPPSSLNDDVISFSGLG